VDVEPGLHCDCDAVRMAQVVSNLLTNAARYTPPGGDIRLRAWLEEGQRVAISVRDNGRGIAAGMLPQVFDLFYQGARGVDRAEGGLGIGLALVRSLVELHGGTVQAESAGPGRGSEFTVRLPWQPRVAAAHGPSGTVTPAPAGRGQRVLLVDDNRDAGQTLAEWLSAQGHEVAVFTDAVAALEALAGWKPQVAILDIGLPVMDGYELGSRIRQACGDDCLLVALTGYGQDRDKARSRAARFDHHLVKPVAPQQILSLLSAAA